MDATTLRGAIFVVWLLLLLGAERIAPKRAFSAHTKLRVLNNFALVAFNNLVLWVLFPWLAFDVAQWAQTHSLGLFNLTSIPWWANLLVGILLLDLVIYWQHRLFHKIPSLWSLHKVHHADVEIDTSTALRFHPIEIALSMLIKMVAVAALGIAPLTIIIFEVLLNSSAMFNHANLRLPISVDKVVRRLVVTPDMHRVHHSVHLNESNANYGFFLSTWDKLFKSYVAQPKDGHLQMTIGLNQFREPREVWLPHLLSQPFRKQ